MSPQPRLEESYGVQLTSWARALAAGQPEPVYAGLAEGSPALQVDLFVDDNFGKRCDKLQKQLAFVAEAFDDFEELLQTFCAATPLAAYDTGSSDGDRFLQWLERPRRLTAEQRDFVACQRARHAVEAVARTNRRGHVAFQERWSVAATLALELGQNPDLHLHLNPIRAWSRLHTRALLEDGTPPPADVLFFAVRTAIHTDGTPPPADVLFFAVRTAIHTAVLDADARVLVEELAARGPCTLDEWASVTAHADRAQLLTVCRDLADVGLVAFS